MLASKLNKINPTQLYLQPSILSANLFALKDETAALEQAGADIIHIDIMDNHFVPNLTFGKMMVEALAHNQSLALDCHLMVQNPSQLISQLVSLPVSMISFHLEAEQHCDRTVQLIKSHQILAGIALNPATPVESVFTILPKLDFVLIMSVNPGFGGQKFIDYSLDKIKNLSAEIKRRKLNTAIQVDGGISVDNIAAVTQAGANLIVAGNTIFANNTHDKTKKPNFKNIVKRLRSLGEQ